MSSPAPPSGTATAPASSGNLGPGFDVLALALELRCRVTATRADDWSIHQDGITYVPEAGDMVVRAAEAAAGSPMHLEIDNAIPRSRGLGSSSAVTTAAAAAAVRAAGREPSSADLFEIVAALEGHGDNAAAAVYGGLVAVAGEQILQLGVSPQLRIVVGIPNSKLSTDHARSVLSDEVDRWAASRNLARVAFLVEGLRTGALDVLAGAGGDELHELPRQHLSPITAELMDAARAAGAGHAAWSGAGPTAIAFASVELCGKVEAAFADVLGGAGEVRCLDVATEGWR
jgi:homoserine kinase